MSEYRQAIRLPQPSFPVVCSIAQRRATRGSHNRFVANGPTPAVAPDADFDARWAAWVERGRAHEQHVRDWFVIWAGSLMIGATIVHAFFRS